MNTIILAGELQLKNAQTILGNLPLDGTMQITIERVKKRRKATQNALMWSDGLIASIAEQAWVEGRQYSTDVWHEAMKRKFLPEGHEDDFERMVVKGYKKWEYLPSGERILVGSTTKLTVYGMACYITMVEAYASHELGVRLPLKQQS